MREYLETRLISMRFLILLRIIASIEATKLFLNLKPCRRIYYEQHRND